ncbi:peptidyl-prolyl cis-trans isomerase CYP26-2, chloroplastic isoform X2 [Magnolia sinica]|uniref:peptidyl-prolyl cis-trans isomerase CYP26-2, chloroplastic isoform X2 n=1 Tax=Magnolia sinica TaxID=86752 RepID=UPI002659EFED|nr:peptidyl-prolyl cis-trans isomerase CYP26-2, chloroplastic isoform X2 [Magnolia sinica]
MRQSLLKALNSSPQIFNPPQPNSYTHHRSTFKSTPSISRHTCKISRRDLTIRGPSSSLLLLLGTCSDAIDPFRSSKARADEGPADIGGKEENSNTDSDARFDDSPTSISNGGKEDNSNSNNEVSLDEVPADNSNGGKEENSNADGEVGLEDGPRDIADGGKEENSNADSCTERMPTKRAFLDISIDGEPVGRIVIGLYGDKTPAGAARFSGLISGAAGISYRRKEFVKIMPNYVQHGGVRSYGVDAELAKRTGSDLVVDSLVEEWEKATERCPGIKNVAGTVGIVVRDPSKPPPKLKLVARKGKLEIDQEEVGKDPNGTEFVMSTKDSPELDLSTLVIGRVLDGMDVVEKISKVKTVQENTASPYFRVAKLIGDKRAVVAERGFNRPYSKILVTNCGLIN